MRLTVELHKALFGKDKIKPNAKKRAFSSATNEVRRSRKRVLIASAMRKQPQSPNFVIVVRHYMHQYHNNYHNTS